MQMTAFSFPHYLQGETLIQILSPQEIKKKKKTLDYHFKGELRSMEIESRLMSDRLGLGEEGEVGSNCWQVGGSFLWWLKDAKIKL